MNPGPKARAASVLMFLFGILSLIFGAIILGSGVSPPAGAIAVIGGVLYIVLGVFIRRGSATAAWVGVGLIALSLVGNVVLVLSSDVGPNWIRIILEIVLLIVLLRAAQESSNRR